MNKNKHSEQSSYREKLIEHLFIGELLKLSWLQHECGLEISKPEVDNSGYDVIAECYGVVRHIQLKSSHTTSSTAKQNVHIKLADKPSGCVVWIIFEEDTLNFKQFLFYGDIPGEPLPNIDDLRTAKHTKGNKDGIKNERPNIKVINKGQFQSIDSLNDLYNKLFCIDPIPAIGITTSNLDSHIHDDNTTNFIKLHRIKMWSERSWQKNHQLIKAFLDIESEHGFVILDLMFKHCSEKFEGHTGDWKNNFNSMKTDHGNSHGKIFYTIDNVVRIYTEARKEIDKYSW